MMEVRGDEESIDSERSIALWTPCMSSVTDWRPEEAMLLEDTKESTMGFDSWRVLRAASRELFVFSYESMS